MPNFCHLHCHTQYSLLDGASDIATMMDKAKADGQKGVALTDHGNMFGAFKFVAEANKRDLLPVIGCEFYLVEDRHRKAFSRAKGEKDNRYHQLMLAKNKQGYENLSKLCSLGFTEGLYSKFPRIDKELVERYHEGLIATSCCIGAEVPQLIMHGKKEEAEKQLRWWLDLFGEDYYIELQRHSGLENIDGLGISQEDINQTLLGFAKKYNVKVICTNDSHYVEEEDWMPHDILLCVNTGSILEETSRFKFPSSDFYFKTQAEMNKLFADVPESVDNTMEILSKIEPIQLERDVLLPAYPVPENFESQDDYLKHMTFEGAKRRYGTITPEVEERLNFELDVIKNSGYPGYFLIVQDFTNTAKKMGVSVGPGRGSAAGSAVAYCIGITNVDPIKYDLLFERFLNPERISMPDIDIDFDDHGRDKVIDYVINKYGQNQVAQIITYGTMAAKSSLRDVGRVMDIPLNVVDGVAKTFPTNLKASLATVLAEGDIHPKLKGALNSEEKEMAYKFRDLAAGTDDVGKMIQTARKLEGSVRNTGIHACGVIITPDDITKYVPVTTAKDSDMLVSQFDNSVAEDAGLLKMDFLGLKTLTIIKDAVRMVKENYGVEIDPDEVPLNDTKTYELFQRGETIGIFQYESSGMQKYMKELKPTEFSDLIAMNALYRPGPLEYIPNFVARRHGREPVEYDLPEMEEYLHETYGICVTGDTLVHNSETGERVRIDQLENQLGSFYVQGVDENLNSQSARISYWVCNGEKEVFEVKLRNGSKVKLTGNHKVLTEKGWEEIQNLKIGNSIATPRKLDITSPTTFNKRKLRVLAYLIADGYLSSKVVADFVSKSDALIEEYQRCLSAFENLEYSTLQQVREVTRGMVKGVEKEYYHEPNSLVAELRASGLKDMKGGCRSWEKFVPEFVFGLNEELIAFFLASVWDCDGFIGQKFCHYKTVSRQLAIDVQTLLLRLGIQSNIYESQYIKESTGEEMTAFQVTLYNLKAFEDKIAPYLIEKKISNTSNFKIESKDSISRKFFLEELDKAWTGSGRELMRKYGFDRQHLLPAGKKRPRISVDVVKPLTEVLDLPNTVKNLNVRWEEIISITPVGKELVYDITVEEIHNFVGNNIILHNCVYQEQVMLLSQKLANFSKGQADTLRKAMGKKKKALVDKMWPLFLEGCQKNGHPEETVKKVWKDWEAFASYAFNKSHSTCYAFVAFQTAFLKAHYPAEFMASVLTHNKNDISKVTFFLRECKRMGLDVLGPDINESVSDFSVNKKGQIRFGLSALKGVGEGPVESILEERAKAKFTGLWDMMRRLNLRNVNKKVMESLALGGGLDCFEGMHRAQYFCPSEKHDTLITHALKYGNAYQAQKAQAVNSLFGDSEDVLIPEPKIPACETWSLIEKLTKEKEVTGIYVSGHPLDDYRVELEAHTNCTLDKVEDRTDGMPVKVAGIVTEAQHRISKKGTGWGRFALQDYNGNLEFPLFSDDYQNFKNFFELGQVLFIQGRMEKRWNGEEWQFKVKKVSLLETVGEVMTSSITLRLPLESISEDFMNQLDKLCKEHKGKHHLRMIFLDQMNKTSLTFMSKKRKVNAMNGFCEALDRMGVEFSVS